VITANTGSFNSFNPGDLAVFLAADSTVNNTTFSILGLNPNNTAFTITPVNGTTGNTALRCSGSASTTGYLSDSDDGTLLAFTGANTNDTGSNVNTCLLRGIGTLNNSATFALQTNYTGLSGQQTRGACSINNSLWYVGDQNGIYTNGASSPATGTSGLSFRGVKSFGRTLCVLLPNSSAVVVNTLSSSGTTNGLPGLGSDNNASDFYLISSGNNGSTFDVLYTIGADAVKKYSLVDGSWTGNGSYSSQTGFGICAAKSGSGAVIYVTSGGGATAANSVIKLTDTAGYNSTINISGTTTLYTATSPATLKGIAFAPVSFSVAYDGNNNTGGNAPTDNNSYANGATVTVLGNTGNMVRTGYTFAGWNTAANGSGTTYSAGGTFAISSNTTCYAVWTLNPPAANPATYSRAAGTSLKISITNLMSNASDPAGDPLQLLSVAGGLPTNNMIIATTTNGSTIFIASNCNNSAYLILTPANNSNESFQYIVDDSVSPSLTATNLINIVVTNAVGQVTGNIIANLSGNSITTTWAGVVGDNYVVQRATTLSPTPNWADIWTTNSVPGVFTYTDDFHDLGYVAPPQAYYRLRSN